MGIFSRLGTLIKSNLNDLISKAEDPQKMLNQIVLDYTDAIREAEEAVAQTIGNLRLQEDDAKEAGEAATEWGSKAAAASKRADAMRAAGNAADADRFDSLAKIAIKRQIGYEEQVKAFGPQIEQQTALVTQLKDGLNVMRAKREELVQKKDQLIARAKMAQAQVQVQQSIKSVNIMDPTSEVARFEEKVRHQEAMAKGMTEVAASSLDSQFASLDDAESDIEVDTRLAALKQGG